MGPLAEEIDEWFVYQFWQWVRLNSAQKSFERQWEQHMGSDTAWEDVETETRNKFVTDILASISAADPKECFVAVEVVLYIVLGRWADTAGGSAAAGDESTARSVATSTQLDAIKAGVELVAQLGGVPIIFKALRNAFESFW